MAKSDDQAIVDATAAAIAAVRSLFSNSDINPRAMCGSLSDTELGYVVAAAVFAWIKSKAAHGLSEGVNGQEQAIRHMGRDIEPWETAAVEFCLPSISNVDGIDWSKPVGEWSKDEIIKFAWHCHRQVDSARAIQADNTPNVVRRSLGSEEREYYAANGGSLMTADEMGETF